MNHKVARLIASSKPLEPSIPVAYSADLSRRVIEAWQNKEGSQRQLAQRFTRSACPLCETYGCVAKTDAAGAKVGSRYHFLLPCPSPNRTLREASYKWRGARKAPPPGIMKPTLSSNVCVGNALTYARYRQVAEMVNERGMEVHHENLPLGSALSI